MRRTVWNKAIPQKEVIEIELKERAWYYFRLSQNETAYQANQADVRRMGNMGAEWFGCEGSIVRCIDPHPGTVYLFRLRNALNQITAWDAFIFDDERKWSRPDSWDAFVEVGSQSMRVCFSNSSLETSEDGISEEQVLRLWARRATLSDLLLIDWLAKTQPRLREALAEAEKLRGAVRSKSAARIRILLEETISGVPSLQRT